MTVAAGTLRARAARQWRVLAALSDDGPQRQIDIAEMCFESDQAWLDAQLSDVVFLLDKLCEDP